jgi:predicted nucleotidyltransferase
MDPRVKERVDEFLVTLERSPLSRRVLGVVVSGSAARQEEIWHDDQLLSDIDLMVLTRHTDPRLIAGLDELVLRHRHRGIDGGQVPVGPLARYLTLAFHEARASGVVVWGEIELSRLIPETDPAELPVWEGVRVLANRLVEHVKYDDGLIDAERVVAKSYEALAEAYLVAEGRYRPSYAERLAEIERAPPAAPPDVVAGMVSALRARLGHGPPTASDVPAGRAHLIAGLGRLGGAYTGSAGSATAQLTRLCATERHWRHRLYWAATLARQRRWRDVAIAPDPILLVWQRTLTLVSRPTSARERGQLLRDWRACPQILMRRAPLKNQRRLTP